MDKYDSISVAVGGNWKRLRRGSTKFGDLSSSPKEHTQVTCEAKIASIPPNYKKPSGVSEGCKTGHRVRGELARLGAKVFQSYFCTISQFFPNSGVIRHIKYWLHFSMFDNVSYAVYSDYF